MRQGTFGLGEVWRGAAKRKVGVMQSWGPSREVEKVKVKDAEKVRRDTMIRLEARSFANTLEEYATAFRNDGKPDLGGVLNKAARWIRYFNDGDKEP